MHLSYSHNHGHISICINSPQALTHLWLGAFWKSELRIALSTYEKIVEDGKVWQPLHNI